MSKTQNNITNNNTKQNKVNDLTVEQLNEKIRTLSDYSYLAKLSSNRRNTNCLDYEVPYLIEYKGKILANPYAFSDSKGSTGPDNKSKYSFRPSTHFNDKTSGGNKYTRILLHSVMWRWYHYGKKVTKTISHLTDNGFNVSPDDLIHESMDINKVRVACRKEGWYKQYHDEDGKYMRCPHDPPCRERIDIPSDETFKKKDVKPIGYARLLELRELRRHNIENHEITFYSKTHK